MRVKLVPLIGWGRSKHWPLIGPILITWSEYWSLILWLVYFQTITYYEACPPSPAPQISPRTCAYCGRAIEVNTGLLWLVNMYLSRDHNTGLWFVNTDHVTWILASNWSILVIWPEYWPLIGQYWSRDLNTDPWLVNNCRAAASPPCSGSSTRSASSAGR